jgi:Uma2 family endonuclease
MSGAVDRTLSVMSDPARRKATVEDFYALPEERRFHELIAGQITEKASPSGEHGDAQAGIIAAVRPAFQRRDGSGGRGGWWILSEVEVLLESGDIVRPDVVGWRREHCPDRPIGFPVKLRPDWISEVVSPLRATDDTVKKLRLYHRVGVPHYWLVDPRDSTLTVMRWHESGYITVMRAERGETVRPEPFTAIELSIGTLFGDDPA